MSSTAVMTRTRMPEAKWYLPRLLGTPIWEWPALVPRAWRTLGRRLIGKDMAFWGRGLPGWRDWLEHDAPLEVLASSGSTPSSRCWSGASGPRPHAGSKSATRTWSPIRRATPRRSNASRA